MKKYIFVSLLLAVLLVIPVVAQTITLEQIIQALQANPTLLMQVQQAIQKLTIQPQPQPGCYEFKRNFYETEKSDDATQVKEILSEESVSDVKSFQVKYSIPNTGLVGPLTRAKLNELSSARCKPFITPMSLQTAQVGKYFNQQLVVHGLGGGNISWRLADGQSLPGLNLTQATIALCELTSTSPGAPCVSRQNNIVNISGTPTAVGAYTFTVQASNGTQTAQRTYTLMVKGTYDVGAPVISGVSGPATLNVGQQGTWTIQASDPNNRTLSYRVEWGDEPVFTNTGATPPTEVRYQQTATFTHVYNQAGTFQPTFVVSSTGGIARSSLSVNVGQVNPSTITVTSPNGGEQWTKGSRQLISWQGTRTDMPISILLVSYSANEQCRLSGGSICPMDVSSVYPIATNLRGVGSYTWQVNAASGKYWIRVCQNNVCDSSNQTFSITDIQSQITVTSPNGGEQWIANSVKPITWRWGGANSTDKVDLYLDTGIRCITTPCPSSYILDKNIGVNTSYNWIVATDINNQVIPAGNYRMQVCKAGTTDCDSSDQTFTIIGSKQATPTVLTPNGGEIWLAKSTQTIRWTNTGTSQLIDIYLDPYYTPCIGPYCPMYSYRAPYVLDRNIAANTAYNWIVATEINSNIVTIPAGKYQVRICSAGSEMSCDSSDQPFTISQ
jgi:peptidoglycan hydrolase-like protein with peptidoglycan-binding domain